MSNVIVCGYPASGHVNPTLGLVKELADRGEKVTYYSNERYRSKIEMSGARFRDDHSLSFIEQYIKPDAAFDLDPINVFIGFVTTNIAMGKHIMGSVFEEIKAANPDYLIHDSFSVWGKQLAKSLHIPAISTSILFAMNNQMIELDPKAMVSNLIRTQITSDDDVNERGGALYRRLWSKVSRMIGKIYGEPNFDIIEAITNPEALNITFTSKEFQIYAETCDDTYRFVGTMVPGRKETAEFPFEKLRGQPLIYISLGTMFYNNIAFYKKCLEAFGEDDNCAARQVVLSVGQGTNLGDLGVIPENFIVRHEVPQIEILKRAGLFITHGGMNSVNEGLYFQVPLVVFPQEADQFLVAHRVETLGAGVYIKNPEISPAELRQIVAKVSSDDSYRNKCRELGESLKTAGGPSRAADEILRYVGRTGG